MNKKENGAKLLFILVMFVWGSIGIFRKYIPLPSGMIAFVRGAVGTICLMIAMLIRKEKLISEKTRANFVPLIISGVALGANWVLLFEAYRYTTVATATLCYNMASIFVSIAAVFVFRERITLKSGLCILTAFAGMFLVSGVLDVGFGGIGELIGIFLGLGAAVLYAVVMIMNKKIKEVSTYGKTFVQLGAAAVTILPYTLIAESLSGVSLDTRGAIMLLIISVVHTGITYIIYFSSMERLDVKNIALMSYIMPIVAMILSVVVLREKIGITEIIGAVLILGATFVGEISNTRKEAEN